MARIPRRLCAQSGVRAAIGRRLVRSEKPVELERDERLDARRGGRFGASRARSRRRGEGENGADENGERPDQQAVNPIAKFDGVARRIAPGRAHPTRQIAAEPEAGERCEQQPNAADDGEGRGRVAPSGGGRGDRQAHACSKRDQEERDRGRHDGPRNDGGPGQIDRAGRSREARFSDGSGGH